MASARRKSARRQSYPIWPSAHPQRARSPPGGRREMRARPAGNAWRRQRLSVASTGQRVPHVVARPARQRGKGSAGTRARNDGGALGPRSTARARIIGFVVVAEVTIWAPTSERAARRSSGKCGLSREARQCRRAPALEDSRPWLRDGLDRREEAEVHGLHRRDDRSAGRTISQREISPT